MKYTLTTVMILIFMSAGFVTASENKINDKIAISEILFQESKQWKMFDSLPIMDKQTVRRYEPMMRKIYLKNSRMDWMEHPSCSVIERLFSEEYGPNKFRFVDVNGDGNKDIVYSGDAICAEGNLTIVWLGNKKGLENKAPIIRSFRILKAEMSGASRITSISEGCCGDPVDHYVLGDILIPAKIDSAKILGHMEIPKSAKVSKKPVRFSHDVSIRYSPEQMDKYDQGMSKHIMNAVFGNVVSKYLAGATGNILATYIDGKGTKWGLFFVDQGSRIYLYHNPYGVNVGWTVIE